MDRQTNPKSDVRRNWDNQNTPIHYLVHLTDNPNAPLEKSGMTPIDLAIDMIELLNF